MDFLPVLRSSPQRDHWLSARSVFADLCHLQHSIFHFSCIIFYFPWNHFLIFKACLIFLCTSLWFSLKAVHSGINLFQMSSNTFVVLSSSSFRSNLPRGLLTGSDLDRWPPCLGYSCHPKIPSVSGRPSLCLSLRLELLVGGPPMLSSFLGYSFSLECGKEAMGGFCLFWPYVQHVSHAIFNGNSQPYVRDEATEVQEY